MTCLKTFSLPIDVIAAKWVSWINKLSLTQFITSTTVAGAMVFSVLPASAENIKFSDIVVFTKTTAADLNGKSFEEFASLLLLSPTDYFRIYIVPEGTTTLPGTHISGVSIVAENAGSLPGLYAGANPLPQVNAGTLPTTIQLTEEKQNLLSDSLKMTVPANRRADFVFFSDPEGSTVNFDPQFAHKDENPNHFLAVTADLFPNGATYNVFILSDCGSPADVCTAEPPFVVPEPSILFLFGSGILGLLSCTRRRHQT